MGCWNATCGISNLPIMYGEKVVTFICKNQGFDLRPCYSDTLCTPIYFHFRGEYNDYGSVENIVEDECTNDMLYFINKKYNKDFENIKSCIDEISREKIDGLFLFMIKEDLFNTLIDEIGNRKPYKRKFTNRQAYLSKIKKVQKLRIKLNKMKKNDTRYILNKFKIEGIERTIFNEFSSFVRYSKNNIHIDHAIEYVLFKIVMDMLRKSFVPMSGCGSQYCEMYLHKLVGQYMIKCEQDYINELDENYYKSQDLSPSKEILFL